MTGPASRELAAHLMRALGARGGGVPLAEAAAGLASEPLEAALSDLAQGGLAEVGPDGVLRPGPRGSLLSETEVQRHLRMGRYGRDLEIHASVGSTNDVVMRRAVAGASAGLVIAAELQTGGRGRHGRVFDSRPGLGVWSTTLLPSPPDPGTTPRLSLVVAFAVADAVEELSGCRVGLKWPNDVRLGGRKVCGILVEARAIGRVLHVVAGIGLNVHHTEQDFPAELRGAAASLESAGDRRVDRSRALASLLGHLETVVEEERAGRLDLPTRFAARDDLLDREVRSQSPDGTHHGTARGVDQAGRLLLEVPGRGTVTVQSAEATLQPVRLDVW